MLQRDLKINTLERKVLELESKRDREELETRCLVQKYNDLQKDLAAARSALSDSHQANVDMQDRVRKEADL